jgi:hypothetical protein
VAVIPSVIGAIIFSPGFRPTSDSYYHLACAKLYAQNGWIVQFPWLGYTVLGQRFANVHLLQHLILLPFAAFFEPILAIKLATLLLASLLALSIYLVLRRWKVPGAAFWTVIGSTASTHLIVYSTFLKGGTTFFILLIWFIDAVWSGGARRAFWLSWISVYAYVGAPIMLPMVLVFAAITYAWERDGFEQKAPPPAATQLTSASRPESPRPRAGEGQGEGAMAQVTAAVSACSLANRTVAGTIAGLLAGMVFNPFWPNHWAHIGRELLSIFTREARLAPGIFRGAEWMELSGRTIFLSGIFFLGAWFVLLLRTMRRGQKASATVAAGVAVSLGLLGASCLGGSKLLYLFLLCSVLFIPLTARDFRWPTWMIPAGIVLGLMWSGWNVYHSYVELSRSDEPPPAHYRAMAELLMQRTHPGEVVLAPWDDFPGLFLYDQKNHYVAGMNPEFLLGADAKRFDAFFFLYQGMLSDPEETLPTFFSDARHILVRSVPRNPGEASLLGRLSQNAHFTERPSPASTWKVFYLQ